MLKYKRRLIVILCVMSSFLVCACSSNKSADKETKAVVLSAPAQSESSENPDINIQYDSQMLAVIKSVDTAAGIVVLTDTETGIPYTLTYTGATQVYDKYNKIMAMSQVSSGDLVQAYYYKKKVQLTGLCYRNDTWEYTEASSWKVDTEKKMITIGGEQYYYKDGISLLSEGQDISFMDLNEQDVLSIRGKDRMVLSVSVNRGHGYIRLTGIQEFIGGWVEIGKIIKPVTQGMLIVAPEGNYDVKIIKDGFGGTLGAAVERNKETSVDFTDLGAKTIKYGTVEFTITPDNAKLYIAGKETDYSSQIILEYDTYRVVVKADGYDDYTMDLKVNQTLVQKKITLQASSGASASPRPSSKPSVSVSAKPLLTASPTTVANIMSSIYKVIVTGPDGASVYFDDAYVGTVPASFSKKSGTHTLTVSKSGYVTKSYTVEIGTDLTDVTFALPALAAE